MMKMILIILLGIMVNCSLFANGTFSTTLITENIHYDNIENVIIEGDIFNINVYPSTSSLLDADFIISKQLRRNERIMVYHEKNGTTLKIEVRKTELYPFFDIDPSLETRMILKVPYDISITIISTSGNINIESLILEKIDFQSQTGNIYIRNTKAQLDITTSSGNILFDNCEGFFNLFTLSGIIKVDNCSGEIFADSSFGNILVNHFMGRLNLKTNTGYIAGNFVKLTAESYLYTNSGDISLGLSNTLTEVQFKLFSDTGLLFVNDVTSIKQLNFGTGPIVINGISSSGNQKFTF